MVLGWVGLGWVVVLPRERIVFCLGITFLPVCSPSMYAHTITNQPGKVCDCEANAVGYLAGEVQFLPFCDTGRALRR